MPRRIKNWKNVRYTMPQIMYRTEELEQEVSQKSSLEAINSFYSLSQSSNNSSTVSSLESVPAVIISKIVIEKIDELSPVTGKGSTLGSAFYSKCLTAVMKQPSIMNKFEEDLVIIYLKQIVIMLKSAGIIAIKKKKVFINKRTNSLYSELLENFWNEALWNELFPSDPLAADALWKNRNIFSDLLRSGKVQTLTEITDEFFELTGFGRKRDMFLISFIDFYLVTWLNLFGLVSTDETNTGEISLSLSPLGKKVLAHLQ